MFANAYAKAAKFTRPVVILATTSNGEVQCSLGAFILLNKDGWVLTAAHIIAPLVVFEENKIAIAEYQKKVEGINSNASLGYKEKQKLINKVPRIKEGLTNVIAWWARNSDENKIDKFHYFNEGDIALGQIKDFKPTKDDEYPKIKNPKNIRFGTSLCKLGFPFCEIKATFDQGKKNYEIPLGIFPVPFFPIEGIYTRNIIYANPAITTEFEVKQIETSSPGLKGQSGGPIFDKDGVVWAIQSSTEHYPLGFNPSIKKGGKTIEENQFLNVGRGAHPELIISILDKYGVHYEMAD